MRNTGRIDIREEDLEEHFVRSRGPGGQKINKTSSCVYLKHIPTGLEVKCREERSQVLNRMRARQILAEKIERLRQRKEAEARSGLEKIKRRNRTKPASLKLKILEEKRRHSQKKALRASVRGIE
jgi:protein subunit release factor B